MWLGSCVVVWFRSVMRLLVMSRCVVRLLVMSSGCVLRLLVVSSCVWVRRWRWLIALGWLRDSRVMRLVVLLLMRRSWLVVVRMLWLLGLWLLVLWLLVATVAILVLSLVPPALIITLLRLLVLIALWSVRFCCSFGLCLSIASTQS